MVHILPVHASRGTARCRVPLGVKMGITIVGQLLCLLLENQKDISARCRVPLGVRVGLR